MSTEELNRTTTAWDQARQRYPDLAAEITLEEALYAAQRAMAEYIPEFDPAAEDSLRAAWAKGDPAFSFDDLQIDWSLFSQVLNWLGGVVVGGQDFNSQGEAAWRVSQLAQADPAELAWLARGVYEEGGQGDLEDNLMAAALKPFLWQIGKAAQPLFDPTGWMRGWCPICGAGPDFASVANADGLRSLSCSRCDTAWSFPRVGCPFCGNTNPRSVAYYPTDDEFYRLYACTDCRRYLKTVDLRQLRRGLLLPLDRTVTYGLDLAARENGYS